MKLIQLNSLTGRNTATPMVGWLSTLFLATMANTALGQTLPNNAVPLANPLTAAGSLARLAPPTLNALPNIVQPVLPNVELTTPVIPSASLPTVDAIRAAPAIAMPEIADTVRRQVGVATAATRGLARLVAPGNEDFGVVVARIGSTARADVSSLTVDFDGDGLINFELAPGIVDVASTLGESGGNALNSLAGRNVSMAASAADQVLDSVINMEGVLPATTFEISNGTVVLGAVRPLRTAGQVDVAPAATIAGCEGQKCDREDPEPDPIDGPLPDLPEDYSDHLRPALADFDFDSEPGDLVDTSIMLPLRGREREGDLFSNYGNEEIW